VVVVLVIQPPGQVDPLLPVKMSPQWAEVVVVVLVLGLRLHRLAVRVDITLQAR
jgi:hypothetical protein